MKIFACAAGFLHSLSHFALSPAIQYFQSVNQMNAADFVDSGSQSDWKFMGFGGEGNLFL